MYISKLAISARHAIHVQDSSANDGGLQQNGGLGFKKIPSWTDAFEGKTHVLAVMPRRKELANRPGR